MNSVFQQIKAKFYIDLPYYYNDDLQKAVKLEISSKLLQYDPDIDGVIMAYSHAQALPENKKKKTCFCYADSAFVHKRMQATFLVFKPYKGCLLPAAVTFVSSSAISLTIFDYFQGYPDLNEHRENWAFRADKWVRKDNDSQSFAQNDFVVVEVTDVFPSNEGYVLNVRIIRKSDIPPIEQIEPDATENYQGDEGIE